jgi:hypothetical protein
MTFSSNGASDEQGQKAQPVLTRADVERLLAGAGSPAKLNLSGVSLNKADLSNLDLSGANFSETDLTRANLSRANLSGANLREANLFIANLHGAILRQANLSGAKLNPAELGQADLSEADLSGADLSSADLSTTRIQGANFSGANLTDVYLTARQKDQLLLSKAAVHGANTIRLVFDIEEEPVPLSAPAPAPSFAAEPAYQELHLSFDPGESRLDAVQFGLALVGLGRLYAKAGLINQGLYSQVAAISHGGDFSSEETGQLSLKQLGRAENGFKITFGLDQGASQLAKALENALNGPLPLEEQAARLIDELKPGLDADLKKVLAQLLLPELTQLSRLPGLSLKAE